MCLCFCFRHGLCCVFFVVLCLFSELNASPIRIKREIAEEDVQRYLMTFGYLPQSTDGAFALRTEESVRSSLRELQQFAGIPVTGRLDAHTVKLLRRPRCGLPDKINQTSGRRKRFTLQGEKWPYLNLTWSLRTKHLKGLDPYEVRYIIAKAFEVWSRHSKLTFAEVDDNKADILIYFYSRDHGDNFDFDGKGVVLAHAFFPNGGRSTDVHFDADEDWSLSSDPNAEGTNFFNVAAHEFGHSLGLAHSSVDTALMYPWYKEIEQNGLEYELPEDDKNAVQTLYGAREDRLWGRIYPYNPPQTTTTTTHRPWRTQPRHTQRPSHTTPRSRRPYDPRYPNGFNPKYPYGTNKPGKYPQYPQKPMHPNKKPIYNRPDHRNTPMRPQTPARVTPSYENPDKYNPKPVHPRREHHPHKESNPSRPKPDTCDTSYDAVSVIRREVFFFKDTYFWRIGDEGLMDGYPAEIRRLWRSLPHNLTHIDAVYERPDNKIVFFVGKQYYLFTGNKLEYGYPKPITDLGLPSSLEKVDGAMVWGHNGKTFFFSGNEYWRYDEDTGSVEPDYPRNMSMWKGVGNNIDAVFQWKDGKTYFFKGNGFWKFNDQHMRVDTEEQKISASFWMGCTVNIEGKNKKESQQASKANNTRIVSSSLIVVILTFYSLKIYY